MVAQMVSEQVPQDDSRPGLPGDLEVLGRVVERFFEGSINFLASHFELGRAALIIESSGQDWKKCSSIEAVEALGKELIEGNKKAEKPTKVKAIKADAKPAPTPFPQTPEVFEPEVRFTPGLILNKDGVDHVVCQGKFGKCLRLTPMSEARVAVNLNTVLRALGVKRLEDVTAHRLLQKSFCTKCAETVLPIGSQTVPEALAAIDKIFSDEKATEETRFQREAEARVDASVSERECKAHAARSGREISHALGLVRPARRDKTGKLVAGVSSDEYYQLGLAEKIIRASGITAADVRLIKNWVVSGVVKMAKDRLSAIMS